MSAGLNSPLEAGAGGGGVRGNPLSNSFLSLAEFSSMINFGWLQV